MPTTDPRIDAYIAKSQPFAQPLLTELRARMHKAVPRVEETIKWGAPFFVVKGRILATMAAFKAHARFGLWGAERMKGSLPEFLLLTSVKELPPAKAFDKDVKEAAVKVAAGEVKMRTATKEKPVAAPVPKELSAALSKNAKAKAAWAKFPPGRRNEYAAWIADAKTEATKKKRLADAVLWISEGKARNWKYAAKQK